MTVRERIHAIIDREQHDKMPLLQYDHLIVPNEVFWDTFGRENAGILHRCGLTKLTGRDCSKTTRDFTENGFRGQYSLIRTPHGELHEKILFDPALDSPARVEHFVKKPSDYALLLEYFNDLRVEEDPSRYLQCDRYVGNAGIPMVCVTRTPFQQMWVFWVSLERLCVDMVEYGDVVCACLERLAELKADELKTIARLRRTIPFKLLNFPDNITAPAIGRKYFARYCVPYYNLAREYLEDYSVLISVHTDGDLAPLHDKIRDSAITALESYTPPPDTDTSVKQALMIRENMRLFMNFTSSVHVRSEREVYSHAMHLLEEAAPSGRVWMQLSEDIPPGRWKTNIPMLLQAIDDYYGGY